MLLSDSSKEQGKSKKRIHKNSDTRRLRTSGIGVIVFGAIFCYFIITVLSGLLRSRVETFEVLEGSLTDNLTFTGFAVREETCVEAGQTDSLLLAQEHEKIAKGSVLFAARDALFEAGLISADSEAEIGHTAEEFLFSFSERNFSTVYSFKREMLHIGAAVYQSDTPEALRYSRSVITAPCDGIVTTAIDGYEGTTIDDVMSPGFSWTVKEAEETAGTVKIVSSENWYLVIPVTDRQVIALSNLRRAKVTFLSDGETEQASVKWLRTEEDGRSYLSLAFKSGLIRYLKDRFISVRIEEAQEKGLKVPASAVAKESFYAIPGRCRFLTGNPSDLHFMRIKKNPDGTFARDARGNPVTELLSPTVYYIRQDEDDTYYYLSAADFSSGDTFSIEESEETYTLEAAEELTGVYQVNNGYAFFRRIEILEKNDIWCLVKKGTDRGIVQHDFIVYDSSKVKGSMILTR